MRCVLAQVDTILMERISSGKSTATSREQMHTNPGICKQAVPHVSVFVIQVPTESHTPHLTLEEAIRTGAVEFRDMR